MQGLGTSAAFAPAPAPVYGPPAAPKASDSLALTNTTLNQLQALSPFSAPWTPLSCDHTKKTKSYAALHLLLNASVQPS